MITKDNMLTDISAELDKEFGVLGTPERARFDEEAYAFYTGQILLDARREAKVTQSQCRHLLSDNQCLGSED